MRIPKGSATASGDLRESKYHTTLFEPHVFEKSSFGNGGKDGSHDPEIVSSVVFWVQLAVFDIHRGPASFIIYFQALDQGQSPGCSHWSIKKRILATPSGSFPEMGRHFFS
jgi:hypothetical protein